MSCRGLKLLIDCSKTARRGEGDDRSISQRIWPRNLEIAFVGFYYFQIRRFEAIHPTLFDGRSRRTIRRAKFRDTATLLEQPNSSSEPALDARMFKLFARSPSKSPGRDSRSKSRSPEPSAMEPSMNGPDFIWAPLLPFAKFREHRYKSIVTVSSTTEPRPYEIYLVRPKEGEATYAIQQSCPHAGVPLDYSDIEEIDGCWRGFRKGRLKQVRADLDSFVLRILRSRISGTSGSIPRIGTN